MPAIAGLSEWVEGRPITDNAAHRSRQPGRTRSGKFIAPRYMTAEATAWKEAVWAAFVPHRTRVKRASLPLGVRCIFYGVRGDGPNYLKVTLDGLKLALGIDDKHFSPVICEVVRGQKQGRGARIEVWPAGVPGRRQGRGREAAA